MRATNKAVANQHAKTSSFIKRLLMRTFDSRSVSILSLKPNRKKTLTFNENKKSRTIQKRDTAGHLVNRSFRRRIVAGRDNRHFTETRIVNVDRVNLLSIGFAHIRKHCVHELVNLLQRQILKFRQGRLRKSQRFCFT